MKLHGWCDKCRKIKRVNVSSAGMVNLAKKGVPFGICDDCQETLDTARRKRPSTR